MKKFLLCLEIYFSEEKSNNRQSALRKNFNLKQQNNIKHKNENTVLIGKYLR